MRYLRRRRDEIEEGRSNDSFTAKEKRHALFVLSGQISLLRHPYDRDPASGSGNCWCGIDQSSSIHHIIIEEIL